MPARVRKIRHDDETRAKIRAGAIISRFMKHIDGKIDLSPTQVSCGKALLAKVLPDLSTTTLKGDPSAPVTFQTVYERAADN